MPHPSGHDSAEITDIRRCGPGMRRRCLVLDGDPWRDVPAALIGVLSLSVADHVDRDELAERIDSAERPLARERALRLLTARERSRAQLNQRLIDDGYGAETARSTVDDLERIGLVDDTRFAHSLARTMANARGIGRSGIARELSQAGVDDETAAEALEDALGIDDEGSAALTLAATAAAKRGATVDRVTARLVRRGYRLPLALSAAREAMSAVADRDEAETHDDAPLDD